MPSLETLLAEQRRREEAKESLSKLPDGLRESLERRRALADRLSGPGPARAVYVTKSGEEKVFVGADHRTAEQQAEMAHCADDVVYWFNTWVWTYDPRIVSGTQSGWLPLDLFPRQEEFVRWLTERIDRKEQGLCEKSRGVGFTWLAGGTAVHKWLYVAGFKSTFGSRVEDLVDKIGDPDSIFEKIRLLIKRLPKWMLPRGFNHMLHDNFKRIVNPENENVIGGAVGEDMGRGGRSSMVIVDEAAFLPNAERVEAAVSDNSDCIIWGSTVNGQGNHFAKKRFGGGLEKSQIFRFHWRDDPRRTDEWARKKKKSYAATPHVWASEYDIDYSASVEGICVPSKWVDSACRLAKMVDVPEIGGRVAGADIGAGRAKSVFLWRAGPVISAVSTRKDPDTTDTAYWLLEHANKAGVRQINYDPLGVGTGVTSIFSRNKRENIPAGDEPKYLFKIVPINAGAAPSEAVWEDGLKSKEKFFNVKAEAWWLMRERFRRTHEHVAYLDAVMNEFGAYDVVVPDFWAPPVDADPEEEGSGAVRHNIEDLISIPENENDLRMQLSLPKWFKNERGKIILESKAQLSERGIASPDLADALALAHAPEPAIAQAGFLAMIEAANARRRAAEAESEKGRDPYAEFAQTFGSGRKEQAYRAIKYLT